ncbi:hypothetical protein pipiens_013251 [Culex pipiens pipiens]|uniref:SET domain-containing protein n=1 Tax=Culex pipiens pipiens TaxID=38569 RepID=A0ABD1D0A4_CULPP
MAGTQPPRSVTPNVQQDYDVTRMREEDFERLAVYIVPDVPCEKGVPGRADKTLPRSLTLKPSLVLSTPTATTEGVWSTGVIPRGTRFGPFEGVRTPSHPSDKQLWRYFWRVQELRHVSYGNIKIFKDSDFYYLDGSDPAHSNWMRYVASAYSFSVMNLVACQHQEHIYFYTIRDIMPNEELMVWYCRDFAKRLGYDIDPERATYSICREETLKKTYGAIVKTPVPAEVAYNHVKHVMGLYLPAATVTASAIRNTPTPSPSPPVTTTTVVASATTTVVVPAKHLHQHHHQHLHQQQQQQQQHHIQVHQTVLREPRRVKEELRDRSPIRIVIREEQSPLRESAKEVVDADSPISQTSKDTGHYEHQLTPNDGSVRSVRSDEGYHSNGYHEDGLTPPEDSSDSESEHNYVLDCSKKAIEPKETSVTSQKVDSCDKNEYRKVKMKMPLKYEFKNNKNFKQEELVEEEVEVVTTPATSTVIVMDTTPETTIVPITKTYYEAETSTSPASTTFIRYTPPSSSSILETILTGARPVPDDPHRRQPNATPPPTSPTEMAYSYKKSQRYGTACSPDSSSQNPVEPSDPPTLTTTLQVIQESKLIAEHRESPPTIMYDSPYEPSPQHHHPYSMYATSPNGTVINNAPSSTYSPPLNGGHYERLTSTIPTTAAGFFVHLKLHKRLHTNDRPYVCQGCDKKYISASGLRTHWKTTSCKPNNLEEELALAAASNSECIDKEPESDPRDFYELQHLGGGHPQSQPGTPHHQHQPPHPSQLCSPQLRHNHIGSPPPHHQQQQHPSWVSNQHHHHPGGPEIIQKVCKIEQHPASSTTSSNNNNNNPAVPSHYLTGPPPQQQQETSRPSVIESSQPMIIECT